MILYHPRPWCRDFHVPQMPNLSGAQHGILMYSEGFPVFGVQAVQEDLLKISAKIWQFLHLYKV